MGALCMGLGLLSHARCRSNAVLTRAPGPLHPRLHAVKLSCHFLPVFSTFFATQGFCAVLSSVMLKKVLSGGMPKLKAAQMGTTASVSPFARPCVCAGLTSTRR